MFILTEKPGVAKEFAAALGGFSYQKGFYTNGRDCITHAVGHVLELYSPEEYDPSLKKWDLNDLPIIPDTMKYKAIVSTKEQLAIIKSCFQKYDSSNLILATDAEREGEFIGALILNYVEFKNYATAKRFWVSSALTQDVILDGLKNAKPLLEYSKYKDAGYARQHADWLIGMNITRLLTLKAGTILTFGRVQTAVLGAIYARCKQVKNFVKEKYFQYEILLEDFSLFLLENGENKLAQRCANYAEQNILPGSNVTITNVETEKKTEHPPKLFNITGLQKYCSQKFKYSPKKTLEIAQSLYETEKCLSYPRTPSTVLGDDNVDLFQEKFNLLSRIYSDLSDDCILANISSSNKRIFNSDKLVDHHALIPLKDISSSASLEQKNVYMAVLERFFTVLKESHIYNLVKITGKQNEHIFTGTVKMVLQNGFKSSSSEDEESELDKLAQRCANFRVPEIGENYEIKDTKVHEKYTQPKKLFTEATLLALMENPKGEEGSLACLGTPATRAGIIDALFKRDYIEKQKQNILITERGNFLIDTVIKIPSLCNFVSLGTTTQWEEKLETNPNSFVGEIKEFIQSNISGMIGQQQVQWENKGLGKCPHCSGNVLEGQKNYYCSNYKTCDFKIWKQICGANITASDITSLLQGSKTRLKKMKKKDGNEFSASLVYNKQEKKIDFVFEKRK